MSNLTTSINTTSLYVLADAAQGAGEAGFYALEELPYAVAETAFFGKQLSDETTSTRLYADRRVHYAYVSNAYAIRVSRLFAL